MSLQISDLRFQDKGKVKCTSVITSLSLTFPPHFERRQREQHDPDCLLDDPAFVAEMGSIYFGVKRSLTSIATPFTETNVGKP
jgi:hypothetical protein